MATFLPMGTPVRQPFGVLNDSKIRSLQSVKNRQNAITPSSGLSLKRRAASPELSDSENVDPNILDLTGKRKRSTIDDDVSLSKPSRYSLSTISTSKHRPLPAVSTPRLSTFRRPASTPASAPAAAGRSPTKPKPHALPHSRKRFAPPPSFNTASPSLSLSAAINGTLAHKKARTKARTIEESKPKSWFFDIFEESEEKQDYRMNEWTMTQSATGLDISDDESKASRNEQMERGKENIDPNEVSVTVTRSMAAATAAAKALRNDVNAMEEEPRTPLGDLNPVDFYAEGLDATSVVLVQHEEKAVDAKPELTPEVPVEETHDFTFEALAPAVAVFEEDKAEPSTADIGAVIMASMPAWDVEPAVAPEVVADAGVLDADIEIWESESAKDENENDTVGEQGIDENVFTLQEL